MNAIIDGLRCKFELPPPQPIPFNLRMVDFSFNKPLGIIPNIRIKIHGILYMMMNNKAMDPTYSMLLGHPWLWDAKVIHDWGTNMVTIKGNGIVKIVFVSNYFSGNIKRPQMVINYNFIEGVIDDEEEKIMFSYELDLLSIGMITSPNRAYLSHRFSFTMTHG